MAKEVAFDFFSQIFTTFRVDVSCSRQKTGKNLVFVLLVPVYTIFLIILAVNLESLEEKLQIIQIVPYYLATIFKTVDVMLNYDKIFKFVESVKQISLKYQNKKSIKKSHNDGAMIIKLCLLVNFLPPIIVQLISLIMQKTFMPIWIPERFIGHEKLIFFFYWFLTTFCGLFTSALVLSIDLLMIYTLLRIKGYSEFVIEKTVRFKSRNEKSLEDKNLELFKNANQLRW